jgi:hypothetical protein
VANISSSAFAVADNTLLQDVSGWSQISGVTGNLRVFDGMVSNRSVSLGAGGYQCSLGTPPSADYDVSCDLVVKTVLADCYPGVAGRIQSGATTFYQMYHNGTSGNITVSKRIAGTNTVLGTVASGFTAGNTYRIKLRMEGNQISGYVDGVLVLGPFTNGEITTAGLPGIYRADNSACSATTGVHYDNFSADTIGAANPAPTFPGPNIGAQSGAVGAALTSNDVSSKFYDTDALTFSAVGSWPPGVTISTAGVISGTPTTAGTYSSLKVRATDTAAQTVDSDTFTFTITTLAAITITDLKDLTTGTLRASESGITAIINNVTTGVLVVKLTGLTSTAGGDMTISDAALVAATQYRVTIILSDGSEGTWKYTAA